LLLLTNTRSQSRSHFTFRSLNPSGKLIGELQFILQHFFQPIVKLTHLLARQTGNGRFNFLN
jgi:hypothetical protein